jgi:Actin like proteins N terminal domain
MVKRSSENLTSDGKALFAFDLGNGFCKIRSADVSTEYRSIYGQLSRRNTLVNLADHLFIDLGDHQPVVFGDDVRLLCDTEPTALTSRTRYTSGMYRLLFASALWRAFSHLAGDGVLYPRGVISIPVGEFNVQKDKEVRHLLQGDYAIHGVNERTLYVQMRPQDLIVIPEGQGTFWDEAISEDGKLYERYARGNTAIVDVGYYTTDVMLLQDGLYVVGGAQSADIGMGNVAAAVHEDLRRQGAYGLDVWQVDENLSQPQVEVNGQCYDLQRSTEPELNALAERILNFVNSTLRGKNVRTVILSGGGGPLLYPFLDDSTRAHWTLATNPRRGNVEGAYTFLLRHERATPC